MALASHSNLINREADRLLLGKHTVFGQVVDGMDVVDRLAAVRTGQADKPVEDVMIVKAQSFS